ncbi:MAG: stage V sporulation protein AD, partial [Bacilli bacterium]
TLANFIMSKNIKRGLFIISSHTLTAEKQFRFPVEYGAPKPIRGSQTATGAVGIIASNQKSKIKIVSGLLGKVIDSGIKDVHNMGAIMAPSAVDTLINFLNKSKTTVKDYDLILTGDLGKVGSKIFKAVLQKEYKIKITNHLDAGATLYKNFEYSGASGPSVLPLTLVTKILTNNKYKKILYLATGSLHSTLLVNQKNSIPTLTHALYLEVGL